MNSDCLCERRLSELSPDLHGRARNTAVVMSFALEKYKTYFPDFTDHTILHSMQVMNFCNQLIGEEFIDLLNADEIYILIMSAYLHDSGMGISDEDYRSFYETVVSDEYRAAHPNITAREAIRSFHQSFSGRFITKYADLFDIPSKEHVRAISLVSEGHRKLDLYDENVMPSVLTLENGNAVRLPYLAALIRLADELDIASDRNISFLYEENDTVFKRMHAAIRHMSILPDRFALNVETDDEELLARINEEIEKLADTLSVCVDVVEKRTPFRIRQTTVSAVYA